MITIIAVISISPYFTDKGEHTRSTIMYTCIAWTPSRDCPTKRRSRRHSEHHVYGVWTGTVTSLTSLQKRSNGWLQVSASCHLLMAMKAINSRATSTITSLWITSSVLQFPQDNRSAYNPSEQHSTCKKVNKNNQVQNLCYARLWSTEEQITASSSIVAYPLL